MEWATEFADYLPYTPMSPSEVEYNRQLIDQFAVNYDAGQYDFTVLACHLVTMRVIYYKLWQSKEASPNGFRTAVEKIADVRNKDRFGDHPAHFSRIGEKDAVRLLWTLGFPKWATKDHIALVDERNVIAHPSGRVLYSTVEATDERLSRGLTVVQTTQQRSRVAVASIYTRFVRETVQDPDYDPVETQPLVEEKLIRQNHLSPKDIEVCQEHRLTEIFRDELLQRAEAIRAFLVENYG